KNASPAPVCAGRPSIERGQQRGAMLGRGNLDELPAPFGIVRATQVSDAVLGDDDLDVTPWGRNRVHPRHDGGAALTVGGPQGDHRDALLRVGRSCAIVRVTTDP